ncbi:hypothetical protein IFM89_010142 [Coptis chinensis]|uniref:Transmembrane protein n=1 Tax=Coptis chinensis TaxID=261450 RepID=A0A835I749_9MAGN|nr:hypothetical protein IFM89_010142 [Coptis chinensis]
MAKTYTSEPLGVMQILKGVPKLFHRNKKIILFIILSTVVSYAFIDLSIKSYYANNNDLSTNSYSNNDDLSMNATNPASFNMTPTSLVSLKLFLKTQKDFPFFMLVDLFLATALSIVSMVAIIYVSAMSYLGKDLTLKDLFLRIRNVWTRPVITWFYVSLLYAGFFCLVFPVSFVVVLASSRGSLSIAAVGMIVLFCLAMFLHLYLALIWICSMVVSVLEDCHGLQALGKAEKLIKGKKVVGIALTFVVMILYGASFLVSIMINKNHQASKLQLLFMYAIDIKLLVKVLSVMAYTLFYFERKETHGEQVDDDEDIVYGRVSTVALVESP